MSELSGAEKLSAHNAMRKAYIAWCDNKQASFFDLAESLNAVAAQSVRAIKNARRSSAGDARP